MRSIVGLGGWMGWLFAGWLAMAAEPAPELVPAHWSRQPVWTIPPARPAAPVIDGKVDYREWYYAASTTGLMDLESMDRPPYPMRLYLCYDEAALYVGMVVGRPPWQIRPKATFAPGPHQAIWWKDDNVEIVIEPPGEGSGYAFVGNSAGGWADLRYDATGGSNAAWQGQWKYAASLAEREAWHFELKIPFAQFEGVPPPRPGAVWKLDAMVQQVTPRKQMFGWSHLWSYGQGSYRSPNKTHLRFGGPNDPIFRFGEAGLLRPAGKDRNVEQMGMRMVLYHQGDTPVAVVGRSQLFRAAERRQEGMLSFYDLWDRLLLARATGKYIVEANDPTQAQRTEADLARELNQRWQHLDTLEGERAVDPAREGAYFAHQLPKQLGDYVLGFDFRDQATGEVLASQALPFAVLARLDLALTPYFLAHAKLGVEVKLANRDDRDKAVRLRLIEGGQVLSEASAPPADRAERASVYLDTAALAVGREATVEAALIGADGAVVDRATASIVRPPDPPWHGLGLGTTPGVPPPFEAVRREGPRTLAVWNRRFEFGENGLPAQIWSRGEPLLAGPMALTARSGEQSAAWQGVEAEAESGAGGRATVGGAALATALRLEYDGTAKVVVELRPAGTVVLDELTLEIPVREQYATLFTHAATQTRFDQVNAEGLGGGLEAWFAKYPAGRMPFSYAFFLGHYDRGIQWFCASDRGWSNADPNGTLALVRREGAVVLQVRFVDQPLTIERPVSFTFGLTVTPTKPVHPGRGRELAGYGYPQDLAKTEWATWDKDLALAKRRGVDIVSSYPMNPGDPFGQPYLYNEATTAYLKEFVAKVHEHGLLYRPYNGWAVSTGTPDFAVWGKEMLKRPLRNAGWGCYWHYPGATFSDWWLYGARKLVEEVGIDGIYQDGTVLPELSGNELEGLAWTDAQGHLHGTFPVWECREFQKRLYTLFHLELGKEGFVDLHDGREPLYFINAFTDSAVSGEFHLQRGKTVLEVFDPAEFAAYYATALHGSDRRFIWWNWMKLPITRNQIWGMALLHDTMLPVGGGIVRYYGTDAGYGPATRPWVRIRQLREAWADATWLPYWDAGRPVIATDPPGPLASAWVDERGLLVAVANLADRPWRGTITVLPQAGAAAGQPLMDAMFDRPLRGQATGAAFAIELEPQCYRLWSTASTPWPEKPKPDGTEAYLETLAKPGP